MRRHPRFGVGWKGSNRPLMWRFVGCSKFEGRDALAPVFGGSCRDKGQIALAVAGRSRSMWRPGGLTRFRGRKQREDPMSDMKYTSFVIVSRVKSIYRHRYRDNANSKYKGKDLVIDIESREYVINHGYPRRIENDDFGQVRANMSFSRRDVRCKPVNLASIVLRESMPSVSASVRGINDSKIYSNQEYILLASGEFQIRRFLSIRAPGAHAGIVVYSARPASVLQSRSMKVPDVRFTVCAQILFQVDCDWRQSVRNAVGPRR